VVEWSRALEIRLIDWCCSVPMVFGLIFRRIYIYIYTCRGKNKNLTAIKSNSNTVWFNFQTYTCIYIYTVRQKLSTTLLVSIISFLIMNLFQIGLLFSLPVHTYLLTCETGYWSIFIYVYMTGCVKCHVYFSTFVFANES
jgi:hypothetical protein